MDILTLFIFIVVGAVVSLDVTALTLSQIPQFTNQRRSIFGWALSNAFWHAGLLFVYILVISGFFKFSLGVIDFLETIFLILSDYLYIFLFDVNVKDYVIGLFKLFREHAKLALGIITLLIVWNIYSRKIISKPELGNRDELPILAKAIYDILELTVRPFTHHHVSPGAVDEFLHWQAQAALVAVDMLALAALMKSMGYLGSFLNQGTIVFIVFTTVLAFAWFSGITGQRVFTKMKNPAKSGRGIKIPFIPKRSNLRGITPIPGIEDSVRAKLDYERTANQWLLITLRMLEPFLIFFFVLELLGFLIFERRIHSVGFFFGSGLLLLALVQRHSLLKIVVNSVSADIKEKRDSRSPFRTFKDIFLDFASLFSSIARYILFAVLIVVGLVLITILIYDKPSDLVSLDTHVSIVMSYVAGLLFVAFIVPVKFFDPIEFRIVRFFESVHGNRHVFLFVLGALIIAATVPIFEELSEGIFGSSRDLSINCPKGLGLEINHVHALQVGIYLIYLFLIGMVMEGIDKKKKKKNGGAQEPMLTREDKVTEFGLLFSKIVLGVSIFALHYAADIQAAVRNWYEGSSC